MLNIQHRIFGKPFGNFAPRQNENAFWKSLSQARELLSDKVTGIIAPKVGFTTTIADSAEPCLTPWSGWFARTSDLADGCIVRGANLAIAIFNGDCPIITLVEGNKLAMLHAGYRTLIRQDKNEDNIIEAAMKHFDSKNTKAFVGFGIGSCCWVPEYEDKPEIQWPDRSRNSELLVSCRSRTTDRSPFGHNWLSVDLYKLARGLLLQVGIPEKNISVDSRCTCCAEEQGHPMFWSHNRFKAEKEKVDGRNMTIAWLQ